MQKKQCIFSLISVLLIQLNVMQSSAFRYNRLCSFCGWKKVSILKNSNENTEDYDGDSPVDMFGDINENLLDEELLSKLRYERLIGNDRWQSCTFREKNAGFWNGMYEVFVPRLINEELTLTKVESGLVDSIIKASDVTFDGVNITYQEDYLSTFENQEITSKIPNEIIEFLTKPTRTFINSTEFRTSCGNQNVGNSYTLGKYEKIDQLNELIYIGELAVGEETFRNRVRYVYRSTPTEALKKEENSLYDLSLVGFTIIRELNQGEKPNQNKIPTMMEYDEKTIGMGIYDPQNSGEPYVEIPMPGKLTLFFPRGIIEGSQTCLTVEWLGSIMRYQVDRKFETLTNSAIKTLELTEIQIEDSTIYPPGFLEPPPLLK